MQVSTFCSLQKPVLAQSTFEKVQQQPPQVPGDQDDCAGRSTSLYDSLPPHAASFTSRFACRPRFSSLARMPHPAHGRDSPQLALDPASPIFSIHFLAESFSWIQTYESFFATVLQPETLAIPRERGRPAATDRRMGQIAGWYLQNLRPNGSSTETRATR